MTKTIEELQADAVFLAGLIGGAEVLADMASSTDGNCPEAKMASNSLLPIFRDMRRRADELADALDDMNLQSRKGAAA